MKNIILIGMMGSGKTTIGSILAGRLKRAFTDTDQLIERREGISIPEIFARDGEEAFRAIEAGVAVALSLREDLVIACGGGLPLQEQAMAALKESGTVIWLNRDAGDIYDQEGLVDRPLAQGGREAFLKLADERVPVYRRWADVTVTDFTSPVSTAARVLEAVKE